MSVGRLVSVTRKGEDLCLEIARTIGGPTYFCKFQNVDRINRLERLLDGEPNLAPIMTLFTLDSIQLPESGRIGFRLSMETGMSFNVYCEAVSFRNTSEWQTKEVVAPKNETKKASQLQRIKVRNIVDRALNTISGISECGETEPVQFTDLTQPHFCGQCKRLLIDEIYQPISIGKRSSTLTCNACNERTSVYAVLHNCDRCSVLLESPSRAAGKNVTCPSCQKRVSVPQSELLHRTDSGLFDPEESFAIRCDSCQSTWVAEFESVGEAVACPKCRNVFEIPNHGELLEAVCERPIVDVGILENTTHRKCRKCHNKIPISSRLCPICQVEDPIVVNIP